MFFPKIAWWGAWRRPRAAQMSQMFIQNMIGRPKRWAQKWAQEMGTDGWPILSVTVWVTYGVFQVDAPLTQPLLQFRIIFLVTYSLFDCVASPLDCELHEARDLICLIYQYLPRP